MGKKKHRNQGSGIGDQKVEKQITGSGAEVDTRQQAAEHPDGKVKCKCIVSCVWRGYRDEGDTVWIERELIEKDAFIRMHFKAVEPLPEGQRSQDGDEGGGEGAGGGENADAGSDNADGSEVNENPESDNENPESDNGNGESDNADGQGEPDLK